MASISKLVSVGPTSDWKSLRNTSYHWPVGLLLHPCLFMAALWYRADHYIFALWFLSFYLFFPRLISAVGDWIVYDISTHGVALV